MKRALILCLIAVMILMAGCTTEAGTASKSTESEAAGMSEVSGNQVGGNMTVLEYDKDKPLFALVESQEVAEKIAEDYGIELVEYSLGVASFRTDKDLAELIEWGKEQGFAPLEINYISSTN